MGRAAAVSEEDAGGVITPYTRRMYVARPCRQHGHVVALQNHCRMQLSWKECKQPGNLLTGPRLLATSSSMQIGHCSTAASSPPSSGACACAIWGPWYDGVVGDDVFGVPLVFLVPVAAVACDDGLVKKTVIF